MPLPAPAGPVSPPPFETPLAPPLPLLSTFPWLPLIGLPVLGLLARALLWPDACEPLASLVWLGALPCWLDDPALLTVPLA